DISDEEAGVEAISDDEVRATYDEAVEQLTRRCISIVQADPADGDLDDQAARAQEIYEALEAGEPFASVVEEESEGSAQPLGGEVGCLSQSDMQSAIQQGQVPPDVFEPVWSADGPGVLEPI